MPICTMNIDEAASNEPGPGPLLSNAECTSGDKAIQIGAVTAPTRSRHRHWFAARSAAGKRRPVGAPIPVHACESEDLPAVPGAAAFGACRLAHWAAGCKSWGMRSTGVLFDVTMTAPDGFFATGRGVRIGGGCRRVGFHDLRCRRGRWRRRDRCAGDGLIGAHHSGDAIRVDVR